MLPPIEGDYHEEVRLADGTLVVLRLLGPGDEELLRRGFEKLSTRSRYLRFLEPRSELSPEELHYLTHVDGTNHLAIAAAVTAEDGTLQGIGVGRFVRLPDDPAAAEPAIVVVDAFQGRGLGKILLERLVSAAGSRGIRKFRATVLADNERMRNLIHEVAPGALELPEGDGVSVTVEVPTPPDGPLHRLMSLAAKGLLRLLFPDGAAGGAGSSRRSAP